MTDRTEYTAEAYVLYNDAPSAKAVILFASIENNIPLEENLATVVKYESILTENGDRERQLSVMVEGIERTFAFADNVSLWTDDGTGNPIKSVFDTYTIKPGDTFRYGTDIDGNIDKMEMIYTIKDGWIRGASAYNTEKLGANLAYVYRYGLGGEGGANPWSFSSAVGLFNSVINFLLVIIANKISKSVTETGLW